MNFTLKTLVAAVALVAASSANAYQSGDSGNSNLVFVLWDTSTNDYMLKSLNNFSVDDFTVGAPAVAKAQAVNTAFTLDLDTSAAFATFSGDNANTSTWKWAVVGMDDTGTSATVNNAAGDARRYLTTYQSNVVKPATNSTNFGSMNTAAIDAKLSTNVNEFVNIAGGTDFTGTLGNSWKGTQGSTTSTVGIGNLYNVDSSFYLLTGRFGTAGALTTTIVDTTGVAAKWSFGAGNVLSFKTTEVTTVVPESDTYAMLLAGLGVMGMVARRRLAA